MSIARKTPRTTSVIVKSGSSVDAASVVVTAAITSGTANDLRQLKLSLMATREKLMLVSPDLLSDADHQAWTQQIFEVSVAINATRNAELESLSADFRNELPAFSAATKKLVDDLFALQKAVAVIKAVAGALSVVTKIAKLAS